MSESSQPEATQAFGSASDPLDAALAAAYAPDSGPPLPAGGSVVLALRASLPDVPCVHLREPHEEIVTPVNLPKSSEMPAPAASTGRLQLVGEIARGGMGAILKGRDVDLGRDIAVKVLLETHQGKTELAQRFIEEAQITGQLQHPGIAPVYELGVFPDRRPYFTMKLVKGKTLAALLAERKDPAEERPRLLHVFEQVCQTLAYAHARGVIHRDLKPSNVMVGAFGEVQVMDWGLAKVLREGGVADEAKARQQQQAATVIHTQRSAGSSAPEVGSHTQAGSVLGTPGYMAPEQARGEVELVDERADVFGLGAILCEVLTGQPPFTGKGAEAQRKAQTAKLDEAYARLDGCGADAELIALAKRCLAPEPWDRPRQAGEVAEAVTAYQQSVAQRLRRAELERAAAQARAEEEKNTRQMAALTSQYKTEFLAKMSHELRTRLNRLLLLSDQLSNNPDGNLKPRQTDFAKTIHSWGNDLLMLINDIDELSKIESGTVVGDVGELRLVDLHGYVERTFRHVAEAKGVGFAIEVDPHLPQAMLTDVNRLQQVIKNLLSNAFKFTHSGRVSLHVGVAREGWSPDTTSLNHASIVLAFTVSDTGIGISSDKQQIIFEAFQQADGSTSREYGGTGLGLAISRELSRLLGGEIRLVSSPGQGSTFTLYLPHA
jgi:signal transduction histidine kinase/tRNA A-37 threonylcarbamoyl transferase component Bud32